MCLGGLYAYESNHAGPTGLICHDLPLIAFYRSAGVESPTEKGANRWRAVLELLEARCFATSSMQSFTHMKAN